MLRWSSREACLWGTQPPTRKTFTIASHPRTAIRSTLWNKQAFRHLAQSLIGAVATSALLPYHLWPNIDLVAAPLRTHVETTNSHVALRSDRIDAQTLRPSRL
jgi:hypothetical protein